MHEVRVVGLAGSQRPLRARRTTACSAKSDHTPPQGDAWLYSTVDDLLSFSRQMEGSALIPPSLAVEMTTPAQAGYGAGWIVDEAFDRKRTRHNGILPGFVSDFIRFPDDKVTIVLLSNLDRARLAKISRDVSAMVFGKSYDMPVRGPVIDLTPDQIARLTGEYAMGDGRPLVVRKDPDYLVAELKGQYIAGLIPMSPTAGRSSRWAQTAAQPP